MGMLDAGDIEELEAGVVDQATPRVAFESGES